MFAWLRRWRGEGREGRGENFLITNLPQLPSPCWCGGRGLVRALPGLSTIPANKTDTHDNTELQTATFSNLRRSAGLVPQYLLSGLTDIESSLGWSWYDLFKDFTDITHWLKYPLFLSSLWYDLSMSQSHLGNVLFLRSVSSEDTISES